MRVRPHTQLNCGTTKTQKCISYSLKRGIHFFSKEKPSNTEKENTDKAKNTSEAINSIFALYVTCQQFEMFFQLSRFSDRGFVDSFFACFIKVNRLKKNSKKKISVNTNAERQNIKQHTNMMQIRPKIKSWMAVYSAKLSEEEKEKCDHRYYFASEISFFSGVVFTRFLFIAPSYWALRYIWPPFTFWMIQCYF